MSDNTVTPTELDPTDMAILYLLQEDARNNTTAEIGKRVGIAASTVSKRIRAMEKQDIIEGYDPNVNYEKAGFDHHYIAICTVPFEECDDYIERVIENVSGVVNVRKFLTTNRNLSVELISENRNHFETSLEQLNELGAKIERFELVDNDTKQPFNHFGDHLIEEE